MYVCVLMHAFCACVCVCVREKERQRVIVCEKIQADFDAIISKRKIAALVHTALKLMTLCK